MTMMEKQVSYAFLFFVFFAIFIVLYLLTFTIKTRRKTSFFIKEKHPKYDCENFIAIQKLKFLTVLTILKLNGTILFILLTLRMAIQLIRYLNAAELRDFAIDSASLSNSIWEFIVINEFFLILMLFPWIAYVIFQYIFERRKIRIRCNKMM